MLQTDSRSCVGTRGTRIWSCWKRTPWTWLVLIGRHGWTGCLWRTWVSLGNMTGDRCRTFYGRFGTRCVLPLLTLFFFGSLTALYMTRRLCCYSSTQKHHYQDLPEHVKRHVGPMPEGYLSYFTRRYPRLFLHVHSVIASSSLRQESMFRSYFDLTD